MYSKETKAMMAQPTVERIMQLQAVMNTAMSLAVEELETVPPDGRTYVWELLASLPAKWAEIDAAVYEGRVPNIKWGWPS
jgi:hypothetical protein